MPPAGTPGPARVAGLDGIRGIAIALVLFSHAFIYHSTGRVADAGHAAGNTGVTVFFVLSGYLITSLLLREEDGQGRIGLRHFYMRRALRLFPALWLYLLVVLALMLAGHLPDHPVHSIAASLFYVRNLVGHGHETDHLWSLSLEEQFYLVWPFSLTLLPRRNRARLALAVAAVVAVTGWRAWATRTGAASVGALYLRTDFRIDAPLIGCALALAGRVAPRSFAWLTATRAAAMAACGMAATIAWVAAGPGTLGGFDATIMGLLGLVLVYSQAGTATTVRWLAFPPLVRLGQVSYGVYLWQQLFLGPGTAWIRAVPTAGVVATMVIAAASYRWIETPFLRLKEARYAGGRRTARAAAS